MIKLVQITGESYDLETGKERPKAIVLSNGVRQLSIEVSDEAVKEIIQMQLEVAKKEPLMERMASQPPQIRPLVEAAPAPVLAELAETPEDDDPGVDYADSSTGTASI